MVKPPFRRDARLFYCVGFMKPRRGSTPIAGKEKLGVGKSQRILKEYLTRFLEFGR